MDVNSDTKSIEQSLNALTTRLSDSDSIDVQNRRALQKAVQKLRNTLETPADTFQRIAFLVKLRSLSPFRVLFHILTDLF